MTALGTVESDALLRRARHALYERDAQPEDLLPASLAHVSRSWRRSLAAGVDAFGMRPHVPHLSRFEVERATERQHELLAHARPVMEYLHGQTRGSGSVLLLADADGLLLHALGDPGFMTRAERVALMPGASWHEQYRGTNAVGTALAEGVPVVVHGAEHFLECNTFLTCAAAPVVAPDGSVLGVLNMSGERSSRHPHTFSMVRAATQMIENRLFDACHGRHMRLHVHPLAEGIGTLAEGVLALSEEGVLVGANQAALALLNLRASQLGRVRLEQVVDADREHLLRASHRSPAPLRLRCLSAPAVPVLHVRVEQGWSRAATLDMPSRSISREPDALQALDTGDAAWHGVLEKARKVLDKPIAVLLHGESGSGKEVLAKAIHASSQRREQAFVAVNCAALPENLIEAELFGYAPGAYTGARREGAPGSIRQAHRGTLFLDEIGDMPLAMQTRLLRVLQERQVVPLGGGQPVAVDFALVCATHRDLKEEVAAGRFRADLYWRLNGLTLHLPALRQRSDWDVLVQRMLQRHAPHRAIELDPELARVLRQHPWPGNLRQLDNTLRTTVALLDDACVIGMEHLPDDLVQELQEARQAPGAGAPQDMPYGHRRSADPGFATTRTPVIEEGELSRLRAGCVPLAQYTRDVMEQALREAEGNLSLAARRLGISRNTFYRRIMRKRPDGA